MRRSTTALLLLCLLAASACGTGSSASTAAAVPQAPPPASDEHAGHQAGSAGAPSDLPTSGTTAPAGAPGDGHDHSHLDIAESGVGALLAVGDGRGHLLRESPPQARPTVALRVTPDPAGGWTVRAVTTGFRWSPEGVNTPADAGTGHAHLYVDGRKVARTYGEWAFVGAATGRAGQVLEVVLYADDHSAWAVDGKPVAAQVVLPAVQA